MKMELSNMRKKVREPLNVTKTKCYKRTVTCDIGTAQCDNGTIKCEEKKKKTLYQIRVILRYPPKKRGGTVPTSTLPAISGYFFLTFDGSILTLCSSNIICDSSFLTFGSSLTFFSYLMVPSSRCAVSTSYVTVLFSHLMVPLPFFSHI